MGPLTIRACVIGDVAALTAIYGHAVLHGAGTFELEPPGEAEMAGRVGHIIGRSYPYLVACRGADVVGYAYANAYRDRAAYRFSVEDSVYVHPQHQGQGVGAVLLRELLAAAEVAGYRQMVAVIGDSGNAGSIRLHHAAGFERVGLLASAGWKHGRWLDVVLMQRALGGGSRLPPNER